MEILTDNFTLEALFNISSFSKIQYYELRDIKKKKS